MFRVKNSTVWQFFDVDESEYMMKLVPNTHGGRTLHFYVNPGSDKAAEFEAAVRTIAQELGVPVSESHLDAGVIIPTQSARWSGVGNGEGQCLHAGMVCNFRLRPGLFELECIGVGSIPPTLRNSKGEVVPITLDPGVSEGDTIAHAQVPQGTYWVIVASNGTMSISRRVVSIKESDGRLESPAADEVSQDLLKRNDPRAHYRANWPDWLTKGVTAFVEEGRDILSDQLQLSAVA